ncbi:hypothetical protein HYH03_010500 [Edaphochlamys debaryana]|uniref:Cytochrome b561 domain-containing protein n=1 Tax=Edaphochlamys debaryana TaxID=47281 RepID=A0A835XWE5_9CHLO|nr:hypothetical protein HYH03_010500 [Edaphochlamys debaryana]|eukprot:KAG2491054.1 hypothetical protein HYH03_010500 [Edaphochlamys debaryana]
MISFAFMTAAGASTTVICPGVQQKVQVSFTLNGAPARSLALLTASPATAATFVNATAGCTNRVDMGGSRSLSSPTSFTPVFTTACSAAGQEVQFFMTASSNIDKGRWHQAAATFTVPGPGAPELAPDTTAASPPPAATPTPAPAGACTPSPLGYQCTSVQGKVTLHWSINTASAPSGPSNPCNLAAPRVLTSDVLSSKGVLHMAVQGDMGGYVSVGFAGTSGQMTNSDIVLGWTTAAGQADVRAFHADDTELTDANARTGDADWSFDKAVVTNGAVTTLCFSRLLQEPRATASPDLRAQVGMATGGSAATSRRRLAQTPTGSPIPFIWAVASWDRLQEHRPGDYGAFELDAASGGATAVDSAGSKKHWINAHGALMAVAWCFLLPLGSTIPAHRWLPGLPKMVMNKALWFWLHITCQLVGFALFLTSFIIAVVKFDEPKKSDELRYTHAVMGYIMCGMACMQILIAQVRPDPGTPKRVWLWNPFHLTWGRLTLMLGVATCFVGVAVQSLTIGGSLVSWYVPLAVVLALIYLADCFLRDLRSRDKDRELHEMRSRRLDPNDPAIKAALAAAASNPDLFGSHYTVGVPPDYTHPGAASMRMASGIGGSGIHTTGGAGTGTGGSISSQSADGDSAPTSRGAKALRMASGAAGSSGSGNGSSTVTPHDVKLQARAR